MEIAVVGSNARTFCETTALGARPLASLAEALGHSWDLLALARDAAGTTFPDALRVRCLLLPGDSDPALFCALHALQAVGYGFSPRDTLTLSSVTGAGRLLCLQRSLLALDGTLLEPQELPLPPVLAALGAEDALLAAGMALLSRGALS